MLGKAGRCAGFTSCMTRFYPVKNRFIDDIAFRLNSSRFP